MFHHIVAIQPCLVFFIKSKQNAKARQVDYCSLLSYDCFQNHCKDQVSLWSAMLPHIMKVLV